MASGLGNGWRWVSWATLAGLFPTVCCLAGCAYTVIPNLRGSVIDAQSREPVAAAAVVVYGRDGREEHVLTDARGAFELHGETREWGAPFRRVPTLRIRVSATCYDTFERVGVFPSFNSIHPPTIAAAELSPRCAKQPAGAP